jgi:hypothetical protein
LKSLAALILRFAQDAAQSGGANSAVTVSTYNVANLMTRDAGNVDGTRSASEDAPLPS